MSLRKTYVYEVEMLKLSDKIEVEISAEGELARDTFFKKFLNDRDERFFFDSKSQKGYNKEYIYGYTLKGVRE
jgi:hypothetical protein